MSKFKDFYDKPFFTIPSYIYNFFISGFYFLLCNILLLIFYTVTFINPEFFNLLFLFIALIPLGPALGALYSSMGELLREKSISITSYFFNSYKTNFIYNLKLWLIQLSVLLLLAVDFQYLYLKLPQYGFHTIFLILSVITIALGLYAFPIAARFHLSIKDLIILSFYYMIKRFLVTLLKIFVIVVLFKFALKLPALLFLFIPSTICFLFTYYDIPILKELELKSSSENHAL